MLKKYFRAIKVIVTAVILFYLGACSYMPKLPSIGGQEKSLPADVPAELGNRYQKALAEIKAKNYEKAKALFTELSKQYPAYSGPWANLAIAHLELKELDKALAAANQATKANEKNFKAFTIKGIILQTQGDFKEAKVAYERALEINDDYAEAYYNAGILADLYLQDLDQALEYYEKYQDLQETPDKRVAGWIVDLKRRTK